jgi:hypothetical protein
MNIHRGVVLLLAALCISGCAVNRPTLPKEELLRRADRTAEQMKADQDFIVAKMIRRMVREQDEYAAATARGEHPPEPVFDVLVLSGGGDYGAFGAGFLKGWGSVEGDNQRPVFDMVTGVSTGALIAPFAFLGDQEAYKNIIGLYSEPKDDWFALRGLFFFLPWNESFVDTKGLRRDLEAQITPKVIQRIAEEAHDRTLLIGTTNLDMGTERGFALGEECKDAVYTGKYSRIHDILMASAAIPGAFPPVVIDDALYVDGGTTANILFGSDLRAHSSISHAWKESYPGRHASKIRIWVIINNQLGVAPTQVKPEWPSIAEASLSTSIRFSTIATLRNLIAQVELLGQVDGFNAECRYVAIPSDWHPPVAGTFKKETMIDLISLGEGLGREAESWRTSPPQ